MTYSGAKLPSKKVVPNYISSGRAGEHSFPHTLTTSGITDAIIVIYLQMSLCNMSEEEVRYQGADDGHGKVQGPGGHTSTR